MLLIDVATTSVEVGGSAARRAKIARIAELLGQARSDPALVASAKRAQKDRTRAVIILLRAVDATMGACR